MWSVLLALHETRTKAVTEEVEGPALFLTFVFFGWCLWYTVGQEAVPDASTRPGKTGRISDHIYINENESIPR